MIKLYYRLTKPGIIYGNALPAIAGFFLASAGHLKPGLFIAMLAGQSLVIASACVFNNYLDREIDKKMERTKKRALAADLIPVRIALVFAVALLLLGCLILGVFTNGLTLAVALAAVFVYVVAYGYFKRRSPIGTVVGSIAGAAPPVIGYCAVANRLDGAALLLFLILVFWQMPHFYAIAIYRFEDYKKAGLPVLPVVKGYAVTKRYMMLYILGFTAACTLLWLLGYEPWQYLIIAAPLGLYWLWKGAKGWRLKNPTKWARGMFGFSLVALLIITTDISVGSLIK